MIRFGGTYIDPEQDDHQDFTHIVIHLHIMADEYYSIKLTIKGDNIDDINLLSAVIIKNGWISIEDNAYMFYKISASVNYSFSKLEYNVHLSSIIKELKENNIEFTAQGNQKLVQQFQIRDDI